MLQGEYILEPSELFISDGSKSDTGSIGDILRHDNSIGVTDPIYPVSHRFKCFLWTCWRTSK